MRSDVPCPTTPQDVDFFRENGYIRYPEFFCSEEIGGLQEAIDQAVAAKRDRIVNSPDGGHVSKEYDLVFNQLVNLWTDYPAVKAYTFHRALAESARRLSECRHVRIYHDHAMVKPPGRDSRATNWHQDAPYWPMDPVSSLSAWIAVDLVTMENGCLHFVPGSHRFGRQDPIKLAEEGDSLVDKMLERGYEVPDPVTVELPAGGVTFHHGCTFHHAGPNQTDQPRRAFAIIYIPDYVTFTGTHDAAGAAAEMPQGCPWDHPLHPILAGSA